MNRHFYILFILLAILVVLALRLREHHPANHQNDASVTPDAAVPESIATHNPPPPLPPHIPGVFSQTGKPTPTKPFPRGENNRRSHLVPVTREVPSGVRDHGPAVLAMTPEDGRLQLLAEETDLHTLSARRMVLDVSALDRVVAGQTARLTAPTTGDEVLTLVIQLVKTRSAQSHTLIGRVEGEEDSSDVQLVYHDGVLHGTVSRYRSDKHLEYRILADGHLMVRELDPSTMTAPCGNPGESPEETCNHLHDELFADGIELKTAPADENQAPKDTPGWTTIDVVVGYGMAARIADGGVSQIEARIISSVDRMTTAFGNSLVTDTELMLLGTIEDPDYIFPGLVNGSMATNDELGALDNLTDGYLDAVSDYAAQLGADLKCFVIKEADGSAGIAYLPGNSCIVARDYMTSSRITFAHELGHNLGCDHSWGDSSQAYHSRYGWRLDPPAAARVRTIMAYDWNWGSGARIPYFSNPAVSYLGAKTGALNGYNVLNDNTADQRYYQGGLGYFGSDPNRFGFNGSNPALGANNANLLKNGGTNSAYGATYASLRATRAALAVTSPAAGEVWITGTDRTVFFTGGDMDYTATVQIFKGGVLQSTLASDINAIRRSLSWSIPSDQPGGTDYMIRVTLNHPMNGVSSVDSGFFTIAGDTPRVAEQTPSTSTLSDSLSQLTLTFSEPMNPATFSRAADIHSFTGPTGNNLLPTITGSSWSGGNTKLTITFAKQTATGYYRMMIGPDIEDMSGTPLNQDFDGTNGEPIEDGYPATLRISVGSNQVIWSSMVGSAAPSGWLLGGYNYSWNIGNAAETPPSGPSSSADGGKIIAQKLNGNHNTGESSHVDTPVINCSDFTDVNLSFKGWAGVGKNDLIYIDAWDGTEWRRIHEVNTAEAGYNDSSWKTYTPSLEGHADQNADLKLRWGLTDIDSTKESYSTTGWQIDSVVIRGNPPPILPPAPKVISHSPSGIVQTNHGSMWLEFTQPMDPTGFSLADITSFNGPGGAITPTGYSWIHNSLLRIDFPNQAAYGDYSLVLSPTVPDIFGQELNQDSDDTPGEPTADSYSAQFSINVLPFPPSGLTATTLSDSGIELAWTDNSINESGFRLQRATTGGGPWSEIDLINANTVIHIDDNLAPGITYHYRLAATNVIGDSAFTNEASATTWTRAEAWRDLYFGQTTNSGNAADSHDFDGDGQINLIERGFKTDPTNAASSFRPQVSFVANGGFNYLALTYRQIMGGSGTIGVDYTADGITYAVQHDTDIAEPWNTGGLTLTSSQNDTPSPGIQTVTVRRTTPASGGREFIRLKLSTD